MQNAIRFSCPHCRHDASISQVQGDRCPQCGFEFKWFGPDEARMAEDYMGVLSGPKYRTELADGQGTVIAHE